MQKYIYPLAFSALKWIKRKFHSELDPVFFHIKYGESDTAISELGGEYLKDKLISAGNYSLKC